MINLLRDIARYLWAHLLWFAQLKKAWLCIVVVIFIVGVSQAIPAKPDDRLRFAGLALQLLGVGTVAYLLRDKRTTFDRKGMLLVLRDWASARPRFRPKSITLQVSGSAHASSSGTARLTVWRNAQPGATVDDRLAVLEQNLAALRQEHSDATSDLRKSSARIADDLTVERRTREEALRITNEKLEKLGAEGLHIEATGLVWLVAGIVLATVPTELACLFGLTR